MLVVSKCGREYCSSNGVSKERLAWKVSFELRLRDEEVSHRSLTGKGIPGRGISYCKGLTLSSKEQMKLECGTREH